MFIFTYTNGEKEMYPRHRVTPAGPVGVNQTPEGIAQAMKEGLAWVILGDDWKPYKVINPLVIVSIELGRRK